MERNHFTFFREYYEEYKKIKRKNDRLLFMNAICEYGLDRAYPSYLPDRLLAVFESLRPIMDADFRSAVDIRNSTEYKEWRTAVFERDNYTCQLCGAHGVKLNAHHKKPFAYFPELRTDTSNGITLCVSCHKKVHHGA